MLDLDLAAGVGVIVGVEAEEGSRLMTIHLQHLIPAIPFEKETHIWDIWHVK